MEQMDRQKEIDRQMNSLISREIDGKMNRCTGRQVNGLINREMDGEINRYVDREVKV